MLLEFFDKIYRENFHCNLGDLLIHDIVMKRIEYRIETARSNNSIVIVKSSNGTSVPLNSRLDPVKEGGKSSYDLDPQKYSLLIILGCSLGYNLISVKEVLSQYKNVIIIDILEGIEKEISSNPHTSFLVRSENIRFFSGKDISSLEDILENEIDFNIITGVQVIEHGTSVRVFNAYYSNVKNIVKRLIDSKARNSSTVKAFGKVFLRNAINNINNFNRVSPVCRLKNRFKGASALIVSSAPSVEEHMDQINMFSGYCYIIAVDSALPVLLQKGINADFVISIDPQARIFEHFLGQMKGNTSFIFSIVSPPELLRRYGGYISLNSHPLAQVIDEIYPGVAGSVDSGTGSVAGDALNFANYAGFSRIAIMGFDFSFSFNTIYARGTAYQKRYSEIFNNRFHTPETFNADYIFKSSKAFMHNGKYTRKSFIGYRDSLEQFIHKNNLTSLYSINSRALPVKGIEDISVEEFISKLGNSRPDKRDVLYENKEVYLDSIIDIKKIKEIMKGESAFEILKASYGKDPEQDELKKFYSMLDNRA